MTRLLIAALLPTTMLIAAAAPSRPTTPPASPAPAPAPAVAAPLITPSRDGVVAYHLAPPGGEPFDVVVLFRAGGKGLRLELPDKSFMLAVPSTRTLVLVVPSARTAMTLPWTEGPQPLFLVDSRMKFTKRATSTIAGQRCTQWEATREPGHNMLCVTDDGLILRNQFQDAQGRRSLVEALAVRYDAVSENDFAIPAGFERLEAGPSPALAPPAMAQPAPDPQALALPAPKPPAPASGAPAP